MSLGDLGTSRSGVRREDISIDMPGKILRESQRGNDIADTAPFFLKPCLPIQTRIMSAVVGLPRGHAGIGGAD